MIARCFGLSLFRVNTVFWYPAKVFAPFCFRRPPPTQACLIANDMRRRMELPGEPLPPPEVSGCTTNMSTDHNLKFEALSIQPDRPLQQYLIDSRSQVMKYIFYNHSTVGGFPAIRWPIGNVSRQAFFFVDDLLTADSGRLLEQRKTLYYRDGNDQFLFLVCTPPP